MGRDHMRGSLLLLLGRVLSVFLTTAIQVAIVRALSVEDFGAFAYALAIVAAARHLLALGQGKMLSRFLSIYEEQRDHRRMFGSLALAALTILVMSVLLLGGLALFGEQTIGAAIDTPTAVEIVLVLMFLAPLEALDACFVAVFAVFARPTAIFFRRYLLTPFLRLSVVVLLLVLQADVLFLATGYVVTQLVGIVIYVVMFVRILAERGELRHLDPRRMVLPFKAVFAFSLPTLTTELVTLSMTTGSVVILGWYWGTVEIAGYRAVYPAAHLNQFIFAAFVTLFLPMAARLFARGDKQGMRDTYWSTALFLAVFTFPVYSLTVAFAPATVETLFGERYAGSAPVLALLALGYYVNVMLGFNTYTLTVFGRIRFLVGVNAVAAGINIALCFALIPRLGAIGVALANCLTMIVQNVANQIALSRTIDTAFVDRRYRLPYVVVAVAALGTWLLGLALRPGIVVAVLLGAGISLALLVATRNRLRLGAVFPELKRIPVLRLVVR